MYKPRGKKGIIWIINYKARDKQIKEGKGDDLGNDKPKNKRNKYIDARWTKKNGEIIYGYKINAKVDTKSTFFKKIDSNRCLRERFKSLRGFIGRQSITCR